MRPPHQLHTHDLPQHELALACMLTFVYDHRAAHKYYVLLAALPSPTRHICTAAAAQAEQQL